MEFLLTVMTVQKRLNNLLKDKTMNDLIIDSFQPLRLLIQGDGPFPNDPYSIDFTDDEDEPCSVFLLMSENGMGKTTLLQIMTALMRMLGKREITSYGVDGLDNGELAVQWDILTNIAYKGKSETIILSLLAGNFLVNRDSWSGDIKGSLKAWGNKELKKYNAESQQRIGFQWESKGQLRSLSNNNELVQKIQATFSEWENEPPDDFEDNSFNLPTLLHFSAYRDIPKATNGKRPISEPDHWGYQTAQEFDAHDTSWSSSLDNILVWMKWIDDGRLEKALEIINKRVFKGKTTYIQGVRKIPPEAVVVSNGQEHKLDRLSSGEKNLVQLFLRIGAHATRNTIILIDEPEVHLHPNWQKRLMKQLREFAKEHQGVTIIVATHSLEMLRAFGFEHKEKGIRKGGEIIERNME